MLEGLVLGAAAEGVVAGPEVAEVVLQASENDDGGDVVLFVAALIVGSFLLGAFLVVNAVRMYRKEQLVRNTPLSNAQSVAMGRANVQGTATAAEQPRAQPFADGDCLYARWEIKEVSTRNEDTKTWSTVAEGSYGTRFYLRDDTGQILVDDPADADVMVSDEYESETEVGHGSDAPDPITAFCADHDVPQVEDDRKYEQVIVPPETELMVFGGASRLGEGEEKKYDSAHDVIVGRDEMTDRFMLTDQRENEFVTSVRRRATEALVGLVLMAVPLYVTLKFFSLLL